jgi:hypothetical protein
MTESGFRQLALRLPDVVEAQHMEHPDFRVGGKIFATLRYPSPGWAMVKLSPAQQRQFVALDPAAFIPANGAWGRQGSTTVLLKLVARAELRSVLTLAWTNAVLPRPKGRRTRS